MKEIVIPKKVNIILKMLETEGYEAYIVGGCVRDVLLGLVPKDWDIAASAIPEEIKRVFCEYKIVDKGERFGTIGVYEKQAPGGLYEITTFRRETSYNDGRHPAGVIFTEEVEEDLLRRDFTINGMAFNRKRGLIDLFGGLDDLESGKIRVIGSPKKRFAEDGLRIVRAMRFASKFGFSIEKNTESAIYAFKDIAKRIASERLSSEFEELILGDFADEAINRYGDVLKDILNIDFRDNCRLNHLPKEASIRFAGIMPGNFENLKINKKILNRADKIYLAGKELQVGNNRLSKEMSDPESGTTDIESHIKMAMKKYGYEETRAGAILNGENPGFIDGIRNSGQCYSLNQLEINGKDLDWLEGKAVGIALEELLNLVISGRIENKKKVLLEYAMKHFG